MLTLLSLLSLPVETPTAESNSREIVWTDTLTAVGTVGAVVVSLLLAIVGWATATIERRKRRDSERNAKVRAQAEKGHWWHTECHEHPSPWEAEDWIRSGVYRKMGLEQCWGEVLVVENKSDAPMYEVVVNAPGFLLFGVDKFISGSLGPRERRVFHISGFGGSLLDPDFYPTSGWLSFADSDGKRWRRLWSGQLQPATTTHREDEKIAEGRQAALWHTLRELSEEDDWVERDSARLTTVRELIASAPPIRTAAASRYYWHQVHRADDIAFVMLQKLPHKHWRRRHAVEWWKWRSGG